MSVAMAILAAGAAISFFILSLGGLAVLIAKADEISNRSYK